MNDPTKKTPLDALGDDNNPELAAELVRKKLDKLYGKEPSAKEEIQEVQHEDSSDMSKHQHYMDDLSKSGLSLHEIQIKWHEYYNALPDNEKRQVWREFYRHHEQQKNKLQHAQSSRKQTTSIASASHVHAQHSAKIHDKDTTEAVKNDLINRIQTRSKPITKNQHVRSLIFGFSMGGFVLLVLLFSFFNERFITPFIRPSTNVSASAIIVNPEGAGTASGPEPKIIIPKINVEAPVVYDEPSIEEKAVQKGLERGVVHYGTTPNPGENGNAVIFGHSSGNILNSGKYKFAFILLKSLEKNDTFIIDKDGKRYAYKVYEKYVTAPTDVSILKARDRPSTMTLVTCDPPGMSTNRLIVVGEQIFPDPVANKESTVVNQNEIPKTLPSNSPSLWQKIKNWF